MKAAKPRAIFACHYCGLQHPKVEAGGIFYCPNLLCQGPGAAYFRSKIRSFREYQGHHTVDQFELVGEAIKSLAECEDNEIKEKILSSAKELLSPPPVKEVLTERSWE